MLARAALAFDGVLLLALALGFSACGGPTREGDPCPRLPASASWSGIVRPFYGDRCFCGRDEALYCITSSLDDTWTAEVTAFRGRCEQSSGSCVLSDGSVVCLDDGATWFELGGERLIGLPGPAVDLAGNCASLTEGSVWCWPSGRPRRIYGLFGITGLHAGAGVCGLVHGRIRCVESLAPDALFAVGVPGGARMAFDTMPLGFGNCATDIAGVTSCWGANDHGQLARGVVSTVESLGRATLVGDWRHRTSTGWGVCGLREDDVLVCAAEHLEEVAAVDDVVGLAYVSSPEALCSITPTTLRCFDRGDAWRAHDVALRLRGPQ